MAGTTGGDGLARVLTALRCPVCGQGLGLDGRTVRCPAGHAYDLAKQGYLSLLAGQLKFAGDSPEMVAARARFLDAGHFEGFMAAVAEIGARHLGPAAAEPLVGSGAGPVVAELGAGTGHYLARVLDAAPHAAGIAVDASKPAARRAARAHPRAASVLSDAWSALPIADGSLRLVMSVFAPRNAAESARMLAPGGAVLVLTPTPRHLAELVGPLGLVQVDERKPDRLEATMGDHFTAVETAPVEYAMRLSRGDIADVVAMGPSARHGDQAARAAAIAALDEPLEVTASALVTVFRRL